MQFGLEGEQQVLLGGNSGLRGYDPRQFSGTKRIPPQRRKPIDFSGNTRWLWLGQQFLLMLVTSGRGIPPI